MDMYFQQFQLLCYYHVKQSATKGNGMILKCNHNH
jgi:hypothetical protein